MSDLTKFSTDSAPATSFQEATGRMPYPLTNDYLFRATLQRSNGALKGLICAILGMRPDEIRSVEIMNPIELGKSIEAKDFILDVKVLLNNDTVINIEMQILNHGNWPERSLGYLCRSFDNLNSGQGYRDVKPVVQVCFLDFTLFKEAPEFFATYMLLNVNNYMIYSDKLKLHVVNLTQIEMATQEDKLRGIDHWARLFKATTWEEIRMLSSKDGFLTEAAETVYQLSTEETIRMQCEAREDYYNERRYIENKMKELDREKQELEQRLVQQQKEQLRELERERQELEQRLVQQQKEQLRELEQVKQEHMKINADKDEEIARLRKELSEIRRNFE